MIYRVARLCRRSFIVFSQSVILSEKLLLQKSTFRSYSSVVKIVDSLMLSVADKSNALDQQTAAKDTAETHSFDDGGVVGATSSEDLVHGGPDRITINSDVSDSAGVSVLPSAGTRLS